MNRIELGRIANDMSKVEIKGKDLSIKWIGNLIVVWSEEDYDECPLEWRKPRIRKKYERKNLLETEKKKGDETK